MIFFNDKFINNINFNDLLLYTYNEINSFINCITNKNILFIDYIE